MGQIKLKLALTYLLIFGMVSNLSAQSDGVVRGAFMIPYERYEADKGNFVGGALLKGPSFDQSKIAAQASERKYVELCLPGSHVSWTLQHVTEGVVLRFTTPDSVNNTDKRGQLVFYVNDSFISNLSLSSYIILGNILI